jgi:hypothetical protein
MPYGVATGCHIAKKDKFNRPIGLLPEWAGTEFGHALWMAGMAPMDRIITAFPRLELVLRISFVPKPASHACVRGDLVA